MGSIVTLFGAGTGGAQNAVATIQIPKSGVLIGLDWSTEALLNADNEFFVAQVAFRDTFINSNDNGGMISQCAQRIHLLTSGIAVLGINRHVPLDLPVQLMEKIYLHFNATAGVVSTTMVGLQFDFSAPTFNSRRM